MSDQTTSTQVNASSWDVVTYPGEGVEARLVFVLDGKELVTFYGDGSLTIDPSYSWSTAAILFLQIVATSAKFMTNTEGFEPLRERITELQNRLNAISSK